MEKQNYEQNVEKLKGLIEDIEIAMMTTLDEDGTLRSRPMATPRRIFDGTMYFFTEAEAPKVEEVQGYRQVNLSYADPERGRYVSVSGKAYLERSRDKMADLWEARFEKWLTGGMNNPNLAMLRVELHQAEYWDAQDDAFGTLINFMKEEAIDKETGAKK